MKKQIFCLAFLFGVFVSAQAVATNSKVDSVPAGIRIRPIIATGLHVGQNSRDVLLEAVGAAQYKTWSFGLGAGIDYYQLRSVPLFVALRKHFQKSIPVFLYSNVGVNVAWVKNKIESPWSDVQYQNGIFYDVGGGWQFGRLGAGGIFVSGGYSVKRCATAETFGGGVSNNVTTTNYTFQRVVVKVGYRFR